MTLNEIIVALKAYFNNHSFINTVNVTMDDSDFNAVNDIVYPIVNIQYLDTDVSDISLSHNFKIAIGDLTNPNVELIDIEIISDSIQVADDFFGWLDNQYDFDWNKNTSLQPFSDSNVDRISGVVFQITVSVNRKLDSDCLAPHIN